MIPAGVKVFVASHPVDFRKGPNGLLALVRDAGSDPFSGALYVFRAKRTSRTTFSIPISIRQGRVPVASALRQELAGLPAL
jgi:transposase